MIAGFFIMELTVKTLILTVLHIQLCGGIKWNKIRCSRDKEPAEEGILPKSEFSRYPWIGVLQYDFLFAERMRYAITAAVRIHPWFALASAEDVAKIDRQRIMNSTHFVVWRSDEVKYYMGVADYILHHEYTLNVTHATVALVVLVPDTLTKLGHAGPALPICLPIRGTSAFENLYVVRMSDNMGELRKEVTKMHYVDNEDCNSFYEKAELDYEMKIPLHQICATAAAQASACVWDNGSLLIAKDSRHYLTLLGFGMRGPGCGAPARFVDVHSLIEWVNVHVAAASYYQCEECVQKCCAAVRGLVPPAHAKLGDNITMPFI